MFNSGSSCEKIANISTNKTEFPLSTADFPGLRVEDRVAGRGEAVGLESKLVEVSNWQCPGWGSGEVGKKGK